MIHVSCLLALQESPVPDPSELYTNVYVKGYGVEVDCIPLFHYFWMIICKENKRMHAVI